MHITSLDEISTVSSAACKTSHQVNTIDANYSSSSLVAVHIKYSSILRVLVQLLFLSPLLRSQLTNSSIPRPLSSSTYPTHPLPLPHLSFHHRYPKHHSPSTRRRPPRDAELGAKLAKVALGGLADGRDEFLAVPHLVLDLDGVEMRPIPVVSHEPRYQQLRA